MRDIDPADDKSGEPLLDLGALTSGVRRTAVGALAVGLVAAVAAALTGASPLPAFLTGAFLVLLLGVVVLVALSAMKGADRAQKRGERLSGEDVGLLPAKRERE